MRRLVSAVSACVFIVATPACSSGETTATSTPSPGSEAEAPRAARDSSLSESEDDAGACTDVAVEGAPVAFTVADGGDASSMPAPIGGTIVPGTYVLRTALQYGAAAPNFSSRDTLRFGDTTYEEASEDVVAYSVAGTYWTSGTKLSIGVTCKSGPDAAKVRTGVKSVDYDATTDEIRLHVHYAATHNLYVYERK